MFLQYSERVLLSPSLRLWGCWVLTDHHQEVQKLLLDNLMAYIYIYLFIYSTFIFSVI